METRASAPQTYGSFLENYFIENSQHLQACYPGLSLSRLRRELETYALEARIDPEEFLRAPFFKKMPNQVRPFFDQLKEGVPLEYITGKCFFYRSQFSVTPAVLIPRNETERLVEMALDELKGWSKKTDEQLSVVDIGTGSGAIILSLMRDLPRPLKAFGVDISRDALKIAERNYFNLRFALPMEADLHLVHADRLEEFANERFHVIVSNPPYIREIADRELVHEQVNRYEPHTALFLKDEDYEGWFTQLFKQAYHALYEEGVFLMEGHEDHLQNLKSLAQVAGFKNVEIVVDYTDRDRYMIARKQDG